MEVGGRVALVTGASSGIGRATARALATGGADVCLVARRRDRLQELAVELRRAGARTAVHALDLTDEGAAETVVGGCIAELGLLDLLVNCAGQGAHLPLREVDAALARALFEINVVAPLLLMRAALPGMAARHDGLIVNIGSNAARMGRPNVGVYAATKSALETLSVSARVELAELGIRVLIVSPGRTRSEFGATARRMDVAGAPPAAGLSPGGGPAVGAELVAERILEAIASETAWTAAPLQDDPNRVSPRSWDDNAGQR